MIWICCVFFWTRLYILSKWETTHFLPFIPITSVQVKNLATVNKLLRLPAQQSTKLCTWSETADPHETQTHWSTDLASEELLVQNDPQTGIFKKNKKTPLLEMCGTLLVSKNSSSVSSPAPEAAVADTVAV